MQPATPAKRLLVPPSFKQRPVDLLDGCGHPHRLGRCDLQQLAGGDGRISERSRRNVVCTENPIRIDGAMESPNLVE
jgi:hypothetical protein